MRTFYPVIFGGVLILALGLIELLLLRTLNKSWWQKKVIRRLAWGLPLSGLVMIGLWALGEYYQLMWLAVVARLLIGLIILSELGLMLSLPISGILHWVDRLIDRFVRHRNVEDSHVDRRRRLFLKGAAAVVPLATLGITTGGTLHAFSPISIVRKPIGFTSLPQDLEGLKILQLSDLHLYHYVTLDDLRQVIASASEHKPDLILVTGDIADDLRLLPEALKMIDEMKPRLGCYASLGNHEYFRGVTEVRRIFDKSTLPLFVNEGLRIPVGGSQLFIGGIDDPRSMGAKDEAFFKRTIDQTLQSAQDEDFVILMSHRPDAFDYAAERSIPLTLAGHTHGGQVGVMGRSIFENYFPDRYLWGEYAQGESRLYTTCGAGHWFPFRLGCPTEAPIIELVSLQA
ncbi:MAG: metallophosphoesterase [candidate division Zixibacteria bacterium]|nr:metallophosphoesterase [candidate division Zixibacteria bacterium]